MAITGNRNAISYSGQAVDRFDDIGIIYGSNIEIGMYSSTGDLIHTMAQSADDGDAIYGGSGNDILDGKGKASRLYGGDGNDTLIGDFYSKVLSGDAGDDTIVFNSVQFTSPAPTDIGIIDGGTGRDIVDLRSVSPASIGVSKLSDGSFALSVTIGNKSFSVTNVESILLGNSDNWYNSLLLAPAGMIIRGGGGDDTFFDVTSQSVYGDAGNDHFYVSGFPRSPGTGSIDGGDGVNTLHTNISFQVDLSAGIAKGLGGTSLTLSNIQNVSVTTYGYSSTVIGDDHANVLTVSPTLDTGVAGVVFDGRGGNDTLSGSAGNDSLTGGLGNDSLTGRLGDDRIDGGAGTDTASFNGASTAYKAVYHGKGVVRISGPDGKDTLTDIEQIKFSDGVYGVPNTLFDPARLAFSDFGSRPEAGGWSSQERYPRVMTDVNGDGRADVIGFGEMGTYVALAKTDGTYGAARLATQEFGRNPVAGGWDGFDAVPRAFGDVNGDGKQDIIGFGNAGTYVAFGRGDGSFGGLTLATADFGRNVEAGGWSSQDSTPRLVGDVNGDGRADVVGFGYLGTYVALGKSDGTFGALAPASGDFGRDAAAGGWSSANSYPRILADINGDSRADVVAFGKAGAYVALGQANGTFSAAYLASGQFGTDAAAGGWKSHDIQPRAAADVNGDGLADLVGFGSDGVWVALNTGKGFAEAELAVRGFGTDPAAGGWKDSNTYSRLLADIDGDGRADIVGFHEQGIFTAIASSFDAVANAQASFQSEVTSDFFAEPFGLLQNDGWFMA